MNADHLHTYIHTYRVGGCEQRSVFREHRVFGVVQCHVILKVRLKGIGTCFQQQLQPPKIHRTRTKTKIKTELKETK